jgi:hypothetical protein
LRHRQDVAGDPSITTPTLVASESTDDRRPGWARQLAGELPNGRFTTLPRGWHGVATDVWPVVITFFEATHA